MVKRKIRWVFGGIVLACALWAGWYCYSRTTPEAQMRKVIAELAASASKMPGEGGAASVLKVHRGMELFTDPATINVVGTMFRGEISQVQIQSHLARYRSMMESAHISLEIEEITVTGDGSGEVIFTGTLRGRSKSGTHISEVREVQCELVKNADGKWQICRFHARDILEK